MSQKRWERNTTGLTAYAKRRAMETRQRVQEAIEQLLRTQQPINFNTVARTAGVTKAYLYTQTGVRERIEGLRQQTTAQFRQPPRRERTDASKDVLLAAKERRIKELETENRRLKEELKVALGKLYERL